DGNEAEGVADAVLKRFDGGGGRHPCGHTHRERDHEVRDERVQLESRDEHDQRDDCNESEKEQARVSGHADARTTRDATRSFGDWVMSQTHACSSGDGSSRVASWLCSSDGGMKWPRRLARRSAISARSPLRNTKWRSSARARR